MSTSVKSFFLLFVAVFFLLGINSTFFAQNLDVEILVKQSDPTTVKIKGTLLEGDVLGTKNWVFLKSYSGANGLAKRVSNFSLFGANGETIPVKEFADGEFVAEKRAIGFGYEIDLKLSENETSMAHVSWLAGTNGLLMLNDLLPQFADSKPKARLVFSLPGDWSVSQSERKLTDGRFFIDDLENAVFLIGNGWRAIKKDKGTGGIDIYSLGKWQFEDSDPLKMAESISTEYSKLFGHKAPDQTNIFLLPFAKMKESGRWEAETRGNNITIISAPMPFKNQALQRLHEQLRHEIFHLWIPNRLNLSGNYSWFYEGFAVYQALKTGVWLGQIRFEDFLSTLGRAYDIHVRSTNGRPLAGMAESSAGGVSASVYSKGMLVAFLTDIAILQKTKGKKDVSYMFKDLPFSDASSRSTLRANEVILDEFSKRAELSEISKQYISGSSKIDWSTYLNYIGVEDKGNIPFVRLKVKSKLTGREKALLKKLGYNRWRKFIKRSR